MDERSAELLDMIVSVYDLLFEFRGTFVISYVLG